jgi:hypothetical protein
VARETRAVVRSAAAAAADRPAAPPRIGAAGGQDAGSSWPRHLRSGAAVAVLSLLVSAVVASSTDPGPGLAALLYLAPIVLACALLAVAIPQVRPADRRLWLWVVVGQGMGLTAEVLLAILDVAGYEAWPTPADALFLLGYVPVAIGLLGLNRQRGGSFNKGSLLDATIVTMSAATLFGVFLVLPIAADGTQSLLARITASAYPSADILLIFLLARMTTGPGARTPTLWLLSISMLSTLVADVVWNIHELRGYTDGPPVWINVLWQAYYVFLALAACHETASRPNAHQPSNPTGLTIPRLLLLGVAALLPSFVLLGLSAADHTTPTAWLALGSVLVVSLVIVRIWDLLTLMRAQAGLLAALARSDPLTGAANRRTWDHELSRACAATAQTGDELFVALLDLDHFKAYNDTHGHQRGTSCSRPPPRPGTRPWTVPASSPAGAAKSSPFSSPRPIPPRSDGSTVSAASSRTGRPAPSASPAGTVTKTSSPSCTAPTKPCTPPSPAAATASSPRTTVRREAPVPGDARPDRFGVPSPRFGRSAPSFQCG